MLHNKRYVNSNLEKRRQPAFYKNDNYRSIRFHNNVEEIPQTRAKAAFQGSSKPTTTKWKRPFSLNTFITFSLTEYITETIRPRRSHKNFQYAREKIFLSQVKCKFAMLGRYLSVATFYLVLVSVPAEGAKFWEFLVGPPIGNSSLRTNFYKNAEQIVKSYGYRLDKHLISSETGHILTLHRIPKGRKSHTRKKPVALIHHGLFGSSDMWLLRGPQHDLPYILADSGYDVWLFNGRGNTYSRKHKFMDPDQDAEYWNFGIEEMGYYDLPVTIDYILNITNEKDLFFLGHSIGSSAGFITCSLKPEYNEKIKLFMALGPLTFVKHSLNPLHKLLFSLGSAMIKFTESMNIYEIMPRRSYISQLVRMTCEDGSPLQKVCLMAIFSIVGADKTQFNTKTFPSFVEYYPSGTSLGVMSNVIQYYLSGQFSRSDFGRSMNYLYYKNEMPPTYNLTKIVAPVSLYYGSGDLLVTEEDIENLREILPNCIGKHRIPYKHFNHLDFVLAKNARGLLYENLLQTMEKYK